ncbi:MAG: thioredoxin-disulfide reductase [Candidatus Omnitrophica bacterium]|nr:thioredoxin-disulfide reductase [Candidatus Omnitrophota bacterium]
MYDVIIVGAGPAGLTAALYTGRSRLKTLILEKMAVGGRILLTETVDNYPGFPGGIGSSELTGRMHEQVQKLDDVEIRAQEVLELECGAKKVRTDSAEYAAQSLIIATGAYPRKLNVPGEEMLTGRGVSYCATCDAPFFKEKNIIVVGGGNSVAEEALYLSRYARRVTIVHRRDELRASPLLQEELRREPKISFLLSRVVTAIHGGQRVEAVTTREVSTKEEVKVACDGVFIFIGYEPDTNLVRNKLHLDDGGFIITDRTMGTSQKGVFACGDCCQKTLFQVVTACAEGAQAADSAYKYLSTKGQQ